MNKLQRALQSAGIHPALPYTLSLSLYAPFLERYHAQESLSSSFSFSSLWPRFTRPGLDSGPGLPWQRGRGPPIACPSFPGACQLGRFISEDPPSTHIQARRAWKRNAPFSSPGLSPGISPGYSRLRSWPSGPVTFPTSVLPGTKKAWGATGKGSSPSSSGVFRPAIYSNPSP